MQPGVVYTLLVISIAAASVAVGVVLYWIASRKRLAADTVGRAEERARTLLRDAEREAENGKKEALLEAKEKAHQIVMEADRLAETRRQQTARLEQVLAKKEEKLTERLSTAEQQEKDLRAREQSIRDREKATAATSSRYEQLLSEQQQELQRVAGLTADEAKELLLRQFESDARRDAANMVKRLESEARETATARAKQLVTEAIQRSAPEHATETTVSVVDLPSDDMKGRIIGREGRNIRALEIATGIDLIVDDTPGAIILSGFDPYRREIARQAIERLITDGRIHPARIEEVVEKVKAEFEETVRQEGEAAAFELGIHDLGPDVQRLMGRLKYRTALRPERAEPQQGSGLHRRAHGARGRPRRAHHHPRRVPARHRQGDRPRDAGDAPRDRRRLPQETRRERGRAAGDRVASHGHRLAVARGDAGPGRRRGLGRQAGRTP